jgi:glutathione S-transferase
MKLYYSPGACSLAVRIVINEIGLTCEYNRVNFPSKKLENGDDFLKINPKGAVPALLTDNDGVLTENAIIQQYLADLTHSTQLLPPVGDFKRYRVLEWLNFVATELHKGFVPLFNPNTPQEMKEKITIPFLKYKFAFIDQHLQEKQFLLGESFSLPDAYLFVMLLWAEKLKIDLSELAALNKYYAELKKRKSVHQSLKEESLLSDEKNH